MAKITAYTENTTPIATDITVMVDDPAGTPLTQKVTIANLTNHTVLDASKHTDSVAQTVTRGSLIYGNSTPKWDELVVGAANSVLWTDGTDVSWSAAPRLANIADTGGTNRITTATTDATAVAIAGRLTLSTTSNGLGGYLSINPINAAETSFFGINIAPVLTLSGNSRSIYAISGNATASAPASSTGHTVAGLNFLATASGGGTGTTFASLIACDVVATGSVAGSGSRDITLTTLNAFRGQFKATMVASGSVAYAVTATAAYGLNIVAPIISIIGGTGTRTITIPTYYGIGIDAKAISNASIIIGGTAAYGIYVGDLTGTSFSNVRLLEIGPATPYLRVVGNFTAAANQTPIYISEGATPSLRQLKTKDGAAITGGDLVCVLV